MKFVDIIPCLYLHIYIWLICRSEIFKFGIEQELKYYQNYILLLLTKNRLYNTQHDLNIDSRNSTE